MSHNHQWLARTSDRWPHFRFFVCNLCGARKRQAVNIVETQRGKRD